MLLTKKALCSMADYAFSLNYRIQCASKDKNKSEAILVMQTYLAALLVYTHVMLIFCKRQPELREKPLFSPFSEAIPWLLDEIKKERINPVNTAAFPDSALLKTQPYHALALQHLANLSEHVWLMPALVEVQFLIRMDPPRAQTIPLSQAISSKPTGTVLTPCYYLRLTRGKSHPRPSWLSHLDEEINIKSELDLLKPPKPVTLKQLSDRLVEYALALKQLLAAGPRDQDLPELGRLRLLFEVSYSILRQHFKHGFLSETEPVCLFLEYEFLLTQFDLMQKMRIGRVLSDPTLHPPLEETHDEALCKAALESLKDLYEANYSQYQIAELMEETQACVQYYRMSEACSEVIRLINNNYMFDLSDDEADDDAAVSYFCF